MPVWHQTTIGVSAGLLLVEPLWTNFDDIFYRNSSFFIRKIVISKMATIIFLGLNVLFVGISLLLALSWSLSFQLQLTLEVQQDYSKSRRLFIGDRNL